MPDRVRHARPVPWPCFESLVIFAALQLLQGRVLPLAVNRRDPDLAFRFPRTGFQWIYTANVKGQEMAKAGLAARRSALWLIWQVSEGLLLSELLPKAVEKLEPKDRARAQRLAQSTLRWADRADRMLGPYLRHKPEDAVLNALRLGVVEMTVDGAAPH